MGAGAAAGLAGVIGLVGVRSAAFLREQGATETAVDLAEVGQALIR